ncbi:MAG: histidine phosphatase family protein [Chloroflexota bacterium]
MSRLLMARHGETELNSAQRYWGKSNINLSPLGVSQAEKLRERLRTERVDAVYASNLVRARLTAEIITEGRKLKIMTCPELAEVNFGKLEGLTFEEISKQYPEIARLWLARSQELEYPGGESRSTFNNRVTGFLKRLEKHTSEESILIVAHSGVLRTLICELLGLNLDLRWQLRCDLASLSILETYPQGAVLTLLNDVSHLRDRAAGTSAPIA